MLDYAIAVARDAGPVEHGLFEHRRPSNGTGALDRDQG